MLVVSWSCCSPLVTAASSSYRVGDYEKVMGGIVAECPFNYLPFFYTVVLLLS